MKKKMDFATKAKLIYSGELLIFAILFLVLATLKFLNVMKFNATRITIFNWITLFGGTWLLVDLIWALFDKKRQKRIAIIDKIIHAPAGVYLITFDLFCLIAKPEDPVFYQYGVAIVFTYLGLCYTFEAIYHFKYPVPGIIDAVEQEKIESAKALEEEQKEESNEDSSKEEREEINNEQES